MDLGLTTAAAVVIGGCRGVGLGLGALRLSRAPALISTARPMAYRTGFVRSVSTATTNTNL
jgi:hypothetical protein